MPSFFLYNSTAMLPRGFLSPLEKSRPALLSLNIRRWAFNWLKNNHNKGRDQREEDTNPNESFTRATSLFGRICYPANP